LLPVRPPSLEGCRFAHFYRPCEEACEIRKDVDEGVNQKAIACLKNWWEKAPPP